MGRPFIETRSTRFGDATEEAHRSRVQWFLAKKMLPLIANWTVRSQRVAVAYVHQDRWIAECPMPGCRSTEFVDPAWPYLVCTAQCGVGPFAVEFPKDREKIEAELIRRPVPATRNWLPGETVADLQRENGEHAEEMV